MAGKDAGSAVFALNYDPMAAKMLVALAGLRGSVGGVGYGLVVTANNFVTADYTSTPGNNGLAPTVTPPVPLTGDYPAPPSASGLAADPRGIVESTVVDSLSGDALLNFLRLVYPLGHQDRLHQAERAWGNVCVYTQSLPDNFDAIIATMDVDATHDKNGWRAAMDQFCTRIWGSTQWGKRGKPLLNVITAAASQLQIGCNSMAAAIDDTHSAIEWELGAEAAGVIISLALGEVTFGLFDILAEFLSADMIRRAIAIVLEKYYWPVFRIMTSLNLASDLDAAITDAPPMLAMEAQAESVGDRALHNFDFAGVLGNAPGRPATPPDPNDPNPPTYPVNLAAQEGVDGAHIIDRHVGKSDSNLQQRILDSRPGATASSFPSLALAQYDVQSAINTNQDEITTWLAGKRVKGETLPLEWNSPVAVGKSWTGSGQSSQPTKVLVVLKYDGSLKPPFVVLTAYPTDKARKS